VNLQDARCNNKHSITFGSNKKVKEFLKEYLYCNMSVPTF